MPKMLGSWFENRDAIFCKNRARNAGICDGCALRKLCQRCWDAGLKIGMRYSAKIVPKMLGRGFENWDAICCKNRVRNAEMRDGSALRKVLHLVCQRVWRRGWDAGGQMGVRCAAKRVLK